MEFKDKLSNFLNENGCLISFPSKRKMKLYTLIYIASKFEKNKEYTEKEVNAIINECTTFNDPAMIRRELYNNRFIDRELDNSSYWLEEVQPTLLDLGIDE